jgi:hypothetical protein
MSNITSVTASAEADAVMGLRFPWARKILGHGLNAGTPASNEFAGISGDYNEILQRGNRCDEQVWLSKGVATFLAFGHHGFPADMNISTAAGIFKLLNSKPNFAERDFGGEKHFAGL